MPTKEDFYHTRYSTNCSIKNWNQYTVKKIVQRTFLLGLYLQGLFGGLIFGRGGGGLIIGGDVVLQELKY